MYISFVDEHGLVSSQYFEANMRAKRPNGGLSFYIHHLKTSFEYLNFLRMHVSLVLNQIMIHRNNQLYIE